MDEPLNLQSQQEHIKALMEFLKGMNPYVSIIITDSAVKLTQDIEYIHFSDSSYS